MKKPAPPLSEESANSLAESRGLGLEHWTLLTGLGEGKAVREYCVRADGVLKPRCQYRSTPRVAWRMRVPLRPPASKVRRSGLAFPCEPPELLGFLLSLPDAVTIPSAFQNRVIELSPDQSRDAYLRWSFRHRQGQRMSRVGDAQYREAWLEATKDTLDSLVGRLTEAEQVVPTDTGRSLNEKLTVIADLQRQIEEAKRSQLDGKATSQQSMATSRHMDERVAPEKRKIVGAFSDGLNGKDSEWLEKALGEPQKHGGLAECRIGAVRPRSPAQWNPVLVADWLVQKKLMSAAAAEIRVQKHFPEWLPDWERVRELG